MGNKHVISDLYQMQSLSLNAKVRMTQRRIRETVLTQEQMRNLNTIVETYGNDAQEDMAIEECSELVKAILKFRRSDEKTAEMRDAVIDEIADVQIMLTQLGIIFNCVAEVEERIDFKINRQMGRIKEREAKRDVC